MQIFTFQEKIRKQPKEHKQYAKHVIFNQIRFLSCLLVTIYWDILQGMYFHCYFL